MPKTDNEKEQLLKDYKNAIKKEIEWREKKKELKKIINMKYNDTIPPEDAHRKNPRHEKHRKRI